MNTAEDIKIIVKRTIDYGENPTQETSRVIVEHNGIQHVFIGGACRIKIQHSAVNDPIETMMLF